MRAFVDEYDATFIYVEEGEEQVRVRNAVPSHSLETFCDATIYGTARWHCAPGQRWTFSPARNRAQPLINYDIYLKYTKLIEDQLESFLSSHGIDHQVPRLACF